MDNTQQQATDNKPWMNGSTPVKGIYLGIGEAEYNEIPALRSTTIKLAKKSLLDVYVAMNRPASSGSRALNVGDATHAAILEPERFIAEYTDKPVKPEGEGWIDGTEEIKEAIRAWNEGNDQRVDLGDKSRETLESLYPQISESFQVLGDRWKKAPLTKGGSTADRAARLMDAGVDVPDNAKGTDLDKLITAYNKEAATDKEIRECIENFNREAGVQLLPLSGTRDELAETLRSVQPDAKFWHEEYARLTEGKTILNDADWHLAQRFEHNARSHSKISQMLVGGHAEVTLIWQDIETGLWCKARLDYAVGLVDRDTPVVIDLKTSKDSIHTASAVAWTIEKYAYDFSAAMYLSGVEALTGRRAKWAWVFAEKSGANQLKAWEASNKMIAKGDAEYRECLRAIKRAQDNNEWPGYSEDIELIDPVDRKVAF